MPQLDKASFVAQLAWFFGAFLVTYVFLSKAVLPQIAFTLKFRNRLLALLQQPVSDQALELREQYIEQINLSKFALTSVGDALQQLDAEVYDKVEAYLQFSLDIKELSDAYKTEIMDLYLRQRLLPYD